MKIFDISDVFTQLSDSSGYLNRPRFDEYLRALLSLPTAVFEGPSFGYSDMVSLSCFDNVSDKKSVDVSNTQPKKLHVKKHFKKQHCCITDS